MIEIVNNDFAKTFYRFVNEANNQLILCAPYIKKEIVQGILSSKKDTTSLSVITSANVANFVNYSSDIDAIEMLINNKSTVINYQRLHAKIYLFDKKKAIITSANLTNNALFQNYEYGILINEDEETINTIYRDFTKMMNSELSSIFDSSSVKRIKKFVNSYKQSRLVKIDEDEDELLPIESKERLKGHLTNWERDVFDCLDMIPDAKFNLSQVYKFVPLLQSKHLKNHHVEEKIRQALQNLRDLGFLKFIKPGEYKKLWIHISNY